MGFWSKITGKDQVDKVIETGTKVVNSSLKGLDMIVYTKEEKAIAQQKVLELTTNSVIKMVELANNENSIRSITRRIIAILFVGIFDASFLVSIGYGIHGDMNTVQRILDIVKAFSLPTLVMGISFFYFGYYGISQLIKKK